MRRLWESLRNFARRAERRRAGARVPIHQGAYLAVGDRVVEGTARDLSLGGVFFETDAEVPVGARGAIARTDTGAEVPVRVAWTGARGIGLSFD